MSLPSRPGTPLASVAKRMLLAAGLLAVSALIVYLGRDGYRDAAHPGQPLSPLASVYYATVTLSTTGYGDIVSKGRAVVRTLTESGTPRESIVVIDTSQDAVAEANAAGLVAVSGTGPAAAC